MKFDGKGFEIFNKFRNPFRIDIVMRAWLFSGDMEIGNRGDTLVVIKPDSFWRNLNSQVEERIRALALEVVAERLLNQGENLPEQKWREFYFPAIGDRPACLEGTSKYMAYGPVKVIHLNGVDAIQKVRKAVGATRPWLADKGTIRGDFWPGAEEANAAYRLKFQQPGDDKFLFNMIHASDSKISFRRELLFFNHLRPESQP